MTGVGRDMGTLHGEVMRGARSLGKNEKTLQQKARNVNSVQARGVVEASGFTRVILTIGDFINI